ncbi:imidazole glycerol phosphate synthase cyclase subunit [Halomonas sp. DQ26W]|uniref:AglZ/HisF2 family acetamidino modification protein n=1 Tax=Halomonas sp. DQ26W TaxID=2282311 RepID=UPI000DF79863|nr:AglZ/HisF2 family acetamidino modification protein [Halomonas sp. DQ26W]RDB42164.1 imidazole glycerol phosphate synthase cyclase subunit [Halomonas sp. DQ26W]
MLSHRVIPTLLLSKGGLVKTTKFKQPKYVGDPVNAIRIFNEKEVDELVVLDIDASREGREPDYDAIAEFASECFMPLAYGGGIRTVKQARTLFSLGLEKVVLQTAILDNTELISDIAQRFGSQSVIASVDIKRDWRGRAKIWSAAKRKKLDPPWLDKLQEFVDAGAGEILLNSVDRDGTQQGYDNELIATAAKALSVPVIALGGAGKLEHLASVVESGASAVAAGSLFVFQGPHRAVLISYPRYSVLESLFRS